MKQDKIRKMSTNELKDIHNNSSWETVGIMWCMALCAGCAVLGAHELIRDDFGEQASQKAKIENVSKDEALREIKNLMWGLTGGCSIASLALGACLIRTNNRNCAVENELKHRNTRQNY